MFKLNNQTFTENNIINSHNFIKSSNIFYAGYFPDDELKDLDMDNYFPIIYSNGATLIKSRSFELKENDIIFCHTMFIDYLFKHLKGIEEFTNIKLITHQTDVPITKELFSKKPNCISVWFSTNVAYEHKNLIPIPIGVGNSHNKKTLTFRNFKNTYSESPRKESVYSNFNLNTNYFHRYKASKVLLNKDWAFLDRPDQPLEVFVNNLIENKYCFAPWGNGYDTHRLWEGVYSGAIPITKDHMAFKNFKDLPIIYLNSYKDLNIENLSKNTFQDLNYKKLNIEWWINLIKNKEIKGNKNSLKFYESEDENITNVRDFFNNRVNVDKKIKRKKTFIRKVHKKTIGRKINNLIGV